MRALLVGLAFVILSGFGGCASTPSSTPVIDRAAAQRTIFAAKEGYGVSERLAITYASLARCKVPRVMPCSDQAVIDQMTKARDISRDTLAAAQGVVDNPAFGNDALSTAVIAAQSGLAAFQSLANTYGGK